MSCSLTDDSPVCNGEYSLNSVKGDRKLGPKRQVKAVAPGGAENPFPLESRAPPMSLKKGKCRRTTVSGQAPALMVSNGYATLAASTSTGEAALVS